MTIDLQVAKVEERNWIGKKGAQSAKRLHCLDCEMTVLHFIQVNVPLDSTVKAGEKIKLRVSSIRQWQDGSIALSGDILNGKEDTKRV